MSAPGNASSVPGSKPSRRRGQSEASARLNGVHRCESHPGALAGRPCRGFSNEPPDDGVARSRKSMTCFPPPAGSVPLERITAAVRSFRASVGRGAAG